MNDPAQATFRLFHRRYLLDLCIASADLAPCIQVRVIDQPYSDHDALLVKIKP